MMKNIRFLPLALVLGGFSKLVGMDMSKVLTKPASAAEQETTVGSKKLIRQSSFEQGSSTIVVGSVHEGIQAVNEGNLEKLKRLEFDVNAYDYHDRTLMYTAIFSGNIEVVKYLFLQDADPKVAYKGMTVLHAAAVCGSEAVMQLVLSTEYGLRGLIDDKDDNGNTPLIIASKKGFSGIVKVLLDAGADVRVRKVSGKDAFHYALKGRYLRVVDLCMQRASKKGWKWLIENHLAHWIAFDQGETASKGLLFKACSEGCVNLARYLIEEGEKVTLVDENGSTPLYFAAENGHKEMVQYLISLGSDIHTKNNYGMTVLSYAAKNGHKDVVELLVDEQADINAVDNLGYTPLYWAAEAGYRETAWLLINKKANLNIIAGRRSLLHAAAYGGLKDIVELLINNGEKVLVVDGSGSTPLHMAAKGKRGKETVEYLISKGADVNVANDSGKTPLGEASWYGNQEVVEVLIANGAKVKIVDKDGYTALHWAAVMGNSEIVELLITNGAEVNTANRFGEAPLHSIDLYRKASVKIASLLIDNGADLNARDKDGRTPLLTTVSRSGIEAIRNSVIKLLLCRGADSKCVDKNGQTPLHVAVKDGNKAVVKTLLEHGADTQVKDSEGRIPFDLAKNDELKALLLEGVKKK